MSSSVPLSLKPTTSVSISTKVLTYIFKTSANSANLEKFVSILKEKLPNSLITFRTDDKGYQNLTITTTNTNTSASPDATPQQDAQVAAAGTFVVAAGLTALWTVTQKGGIGSTNTSFSANNR